MSDQSTWLRLPVMLLFFLLLVVATPLVIVVSLVGWGIRLFTGEQPDGVIDFGRTLGEWFARTTHYLCGSAERRPFPFEDHDCPSDRAATVVPTAGAVTPPSSGEDAATDRPAPIRKKARKQPATDGAGGSTGKKPASGMQSSKKSSKKKSSKKKTSGSRKTASKKKSPRNKKKTTSASNPGASE